MKYTFVALITLFLSNAGAQLVSDIKCSQIDYVYSDSNCCQSGDNVGRCLKQIAQADLEAELGSINTKIDNLQYGGMTVQQSAVLRVGADASSNVADKSGTLRIESDGSIEVMANGKIDIKNNAVLDVSGATVTGLGGSATGDAVSVGYMTLTGIVGDTSCSGELSINGGLKMDSDKFVVADNTGDVSTKGSLAVSGSISASSLLIDTDKLSIDVAGNMVAKSVVSKGDLKIKKSDNSVVTAVDSETGNMVTDGYIHAKGKLYVDDEAVLNKGINVDNKFVVADVTGDTTIVGTLQIAGKTMINGGIDIIGSSKVVSGSTLKVLGTLDVSEGTMVGSVAQLGQVSIQQLTAPLDHNNQASTHVDITSGKMNSVVIGDSAPANAEFVSLKASDIESTSLLSAKGGITVTGSATLNNGATITGAVAGITTLDASSTVTAGAFASSGEIAVNTIVATGVAKLAGIEVDTDKFKVDVAGNVEAKSIVVDGKATASGVDIVGQGLKIADTDIASPVLSIAHDSGNIVSEGTLHIKQSSALDGDVSTAGALGVTGLSSLDGGIDVNNNLDIATNGRVTTSEGVYASKSSSLKGLVVQADGAQGLTVDGTLSKLNGGLTVEATGTATATELTTGNCDGGCYCNANMADGNGNDQAYIDSSGLSLAECTSYVAGLNVGATHFAHTASDCSPCSLNPTFTSNANIKVYTISTSTEEKFKVDSSGALTAKGVAKLDAGVEVSDKFSVNTAGHVTATGLSIAGAKIPVFQEREAVDCSAFSADASISASTAGDGNIILLAKGQCAKRFERYGCGSALVTASDPTEADFLNHETSSICSGDFTVEVTDTCVSKKTCAGNDCPNIGGTTVGGQYCRQLDTRELCEGTNLYTDVSGQRASQVWTATSLEMHMCTSTSSSVKS